MCRLVDGFLFCLFCCVVLCVIWLSLFCVLCLIGCVVLGDRCLCYFDVFGFFVCGFE